MYIIYVFVTHKYIFIYILMSIHPDMGDRMFESNLVREKGNETYQQALKCQNTALRKRRLEEARVLYQQAHLMDKDSVPGRLANFYIYLYIHVIHIFFPCIYACMCLYTYMYA